MSRLFGTDGIRGVPGTAPLDDATLRRLGSVYAASGGAGRYLIGMDTRASGPDLADALANGICDAGGEAVLGGVLPTPAVSLLVARGDFAGGIVVSASHNPWRDNGVKLLSEVGEKLSDAREDQLQESLEAGTVPSAPGGAVRHEEAQWPELYRAALVEEAASLAGMKLVVDCANGAMFRVGPEVLEDLGAQIVQVLGNKPDGRNINENCGSLHPGLVAAAVQSAGADLGIAFDGDGDRVILVDGGGTVRDGDDVLYLCGTDRLERDALPGSAVVGTVMTNVGLETALRDAGIQLHRSAVGDRYVLEEMRRRDLCLGGEPSGHVIFLDQAVTGDGLLTAMEMAGTLCRRGATLQEACSGWARCPQILLNVPVGERRPLEDVPEVCGAGRAAEDQLSGRGRVLLRYSGTELLLRVMVEGPEEDEIRALADTIAEAARTSLGTQ